MKCLKNKVVPPSSLTLRQTGLTAAVTFLGLSITLYAQGTLLETAATMELQQQIMNAEAQPPVASPVQQANNVTPQQDIARFEKAAQKLLKSMQTGRFDREDFSAMWSTMLPADTNFSDSINASYRPVLAQFGRAEKLLEGKIVGPGRAMFPVQFSGGTLDMTISLDEQDRIGEWLLMPKTTQAAAPTMPAADEQAEKPVETPAISPALPEDTNTPDVPDINDFNSFQREINRMNIETRSEEQQWMGPLERKVELARAIEELVAAQLRFIRKLAESENAEQTARAIDLVLRRRRERLNNLETKLSEETREERQQPTGETPSTIPRPPRRERQEPRPTRERSTRHTREATTEGQQ